MAKTFKYKQSQKFRVIIGQVSVYVTAKQIIWGIGDGVETNAAVASALQSLQNMNSVAKETVGLCGTWNGMAVQIDEL